MKIDVRINEPIRQALTLNIDLGLVSEWQRKDTIKDILVDFFEENEILAIGEIEDKAVAEEKQQKQYKCNLHGVSNRRELLLAYENFNNACECDSCKTAITEKIDAFLSQ